MKRLYRHLWLTPIPGATMILGGLIGISGGAIREPILMLAGILLVLGGCFLGVSSAKLYERHRRGERGG